MPGGAPGIDPAQLQMQLPGGSPAQPPVTPTPVLAHLDQNPKTKQPARTPYTEPTPTTPETSLLQLPGKDHNLYWLPAGDEIEGLEEEVRLKQRAQAGHAAAWAAKEKEEERLEEQAEYNEENHNPADSDSPIEPQIHGWVPPLAKGGLAQTNPYKLNSDAFEDRRRRRRRRLLTSVHSRLRGHSGVPPNNPEDLWSTMQTKDADPYPNLLNGGGPQGRGYVFPALKPEGEVEIPSGGGSESASGSFLSGVADAAAAVASDLANVADFTVPKGTFA